MTRIIVLHNRVTAEDSAADRDVLVQVAAVSEPLRRLGYESSVLDVTLDLQTLHDTLVVRQPDVVFNLVESLGGCDGLAAAATGLLDMLGLPYTGASTEALVQTNHKLLAKQQLRLAGLPTPDWVADTGCRTGTPGFLARDGQLPEEMRFILKPITEHASVGMEDDCVVAVADVHTLRQRLRAVAARSGRRCFAEQFVAGREVNVALLAGPTGPEVLPPAEIDFSAFPPGKPRIVAYRAKWDESSFEYHHTPRRFAFGRADQTLLTELGDLARAAWNLFGLRGYARVDFRVDEGGRPWILEVNTNPCLAPDAGFAAAVQEAGLTWDEAIERIVSDAAGSGPMPLERSTYVSHSTHP